ERFLDRTDCCRRRHASEKCRRSWCRRFRRQELAADATAERQTRVPRHSLPDRAVRFLPSADRTRSRPAPPFHWPAGSLPPARAPLHQPCRRPSSPSTWPRQVASREFPCSAPATFSHGRNKGGLAAIVVVSI